MKRIITIILSVVMVLCCGAPIEISAAPLNSQQTSTSKQKKAKSNKKTSKKKTTRSSKKKNSTSSRKSSSAKKETSADIKRRQQVTQQEIKKTKAEIAANDKAVKTGLDNLRRINADIQTGQQQLVDISAQVNTLDRKIGAMQTQIDAGEKELARMREKYLDAVKKARLNKGKQSALAFIFSSESFSQAMRRMRYLKQFSQWRESQSAEINAKVKDLRYQAQLLIQTKDEKNKALTRRLATQQSLEQQKAKQDEVVAELKKNGEALRSHLARKQTEANELRNRISALIAQEQAEAKARLERERKEAEAREQERLLVQAEAEKAEKNKQEEEKQQSESASKSKKEKSDKKKDSQKNSKKGSVKESQSGKEQRKESGGEYAEARKRRNRNNSNNVSKSKSNANYTNFAAAKGKLPRPVSGDFKVVSPFGRHPLPDLPDVVYDNPGIDAQVSQGASAQAVFAGRVSGVYMLPGYNTVVIVNHGDYYTIYGNIAAAGVKVGDSVKQGQALGRLATDPDTPGHSSIHFEIWKNREKLNPLNWIR